MKKTPSIASRYKRLRKLKPELKWQTGVYTRHPTYHFTLPYPFLLLCRLVEVEPEQLLHDFMDNLSCGSWRREGRDEAKENLISYFIAHGYGQEHYSEEDLRLMFKEMNALGMLFPKQGSGKLLDAYCTWRDKHHTYWFKKWFRKPRRKL
jgi:hypothetical protein